MKMSFKTRAASISFTSAFRSPEESLDVSTLNVVGAKRLALWSSCARDGTAPFFCAFTETLVNPISSTRIEQAVSFITSPPMPGFTSAGRKPIMIAGQAVAAGIHLAVQFTKGREPRAEWQSRLWFRLQNSYEKISPTG